jgi:hypothetical protein
LVEYPSLARQHTAAGLGAVLSGVVLKVSANTGSQLPSVVIRDWEPAGVLAEPGRTGREGRPRPEPGPWSRDRVSHTIRS